MSSEHLTPKEIKVLIKLFTKGSREAVGEFLDTSKRDVNVIFQGVPASLHPFAWTALLCACRSLNVGVVEELLERGADPNLTSHVGFTAMMAVAIASSKDNGDRSVACARLLKKAGVSIPRAPTFNKRTLLTRAVKNGSEDLVKFLFHAGADIVQRDDHGETPFNIAIRHINKGMAQLLLDCGANPYVNNLDNESCFSIATANADKDEELLIMVHDWRIDYYDKRFKGRRHNFFKMLKEVNSLACQSLMVDRKDGSVHSSARAAPESSDKSPTVKAAARVPSSHRQSEIGLKHPAASNTSVWKGKGSPTSFAACSEETGKAELKSARDLAREHSPVLPTQFPLGILNFLDNLPSPVSESIPTPSSPSFPSSEEDVVDLPTNAVEVDHRVDSDNARLWFLVCSTVLGVAIIYALTCRNRSKN